MPTIREQHNVAVKNDDTVIYHVGIYLDFSGPTKSYSVRRHLGPAGYLGSAIVYYTRY